MHVHVYKYIHTSSVARFLLRSMYTCFSHVNRMALGMFDPPEIQPYWNITTGHVNSAYHQVFYTLVIHWVYDISLPSGSCSRCRTGEYGTPAE